MTKKEILTKNAATPAGSYSQGLVAGNLIFTAGQMGTDPETGRKPEGIEAQTKQALANIRAILNEAGADLEDVVKVTAHLGNMDDFDGYDKVYRAFFQKPYPVRTTVQSGLGGALVEIDAIAVKG